MSLDDIAAAIRKKRSENDGHFDCAIYVSEDHWRSLMQLCEGRQRDLSAAFYHEQKILGFPVYVAYAKGQEDHRPFYICVTS